MANIGARLEPEPGDLTPLVGAATDVTALGRDISRPAHELTASEDVDVADWDRVAAMDEFKALLAAKIRFIAPITVFFLVYYLSLPLLVGFAPGLMDTKVIGDINIAYIFALSQFIMTWVLAWVYLRRAVEFDSMAKSIIARLKAMREGRRT
jgi:uncharacterized membrane protein (DUF485 family)